MVGFASRRRRAPPPRRGRVVALFGPPGSGKSTIVKVLVAASKESCVHMPWPSDNDDEDLSRSMLWGETEGHPPDVLFLDSIVSADEVRMLHEEGHIDVTGGAVVQVASDTAMLDDERHEYNLKRAAIEDVVRMYNLPYFTINNVRDDLEAPVGELARRAQLRK